jgi:hypothetical protein
MSSHIRMDIVADHHTDYCLLNDDGSYTWSIPECSKQSSGNGSQGALGPWRSSRAKEKENDRRIERNREQRRTPNSGNGHSRTIGRRLGEVNWIATDTRVKDKSDTIY